MDNAQNPNGPDPTGRLEVPGASLRLLEGLNCWNAEESIFEENRGVSFSTHAYSKTRRGAVLSVEPCTDAAALRFSVRDRRWGQRRLDHTFELPLSERCVSAAEPLDCEESELREEFSREIIIPEFRVEAEWVGEDWPKTAEIHWEDEATPGDHYYVRVEQVDASVAWSSPIWIE